MSPISRLIFRFFRDFCGIFAISMKFESAIQVLIRVRNSFLLL
jgi:hypothetical protein